jgi:hypothetical protein
MRPEEKPEQSPEKNRKQEELLRSLLDKKARELDSHTLSRLRQARAHALTRQSKPASRLQLPDWSIAGGLATATVAVLAFSFLLQSPQGPGLPQVPAGDLEILASGEDLELYDRLDFYRWLEEEGETEPTETENRA